MLVSHRKEFIYTKTVKTAGTSVESYFEKYCMPEGEWSEEHTRDAYVSDAGIIGFRGANPSKDIEWFHHMPASRIKKQVGEEIWNRYFKFCVIRDPFDKAVSAFYHFKKAREAGGAEARKKTLKQKISEMFSRPVVFANVAEEFEHWLSEGNMGVDRNKYVIDGEFCVDYVIRYEALSDGLKEVCEKIGVEFEPERLPTFKKGMRDETVGMSDIYTPKAIEIISDIFSYELEKFGYEPPKLK